MFFACKVVLKRIGSLLNKETITSLVYLKSSFITVVDYFVMEYSETLFVSCLLPSRNQPSGPLKKKKKKKAAV